MKKKDNHLIKVNNRDIKKMLKNPNKFWKDVSIIDDYAFSFLDKLENIEIPSNVTSIGREAFRGCTNLKSVKLNEGVENIYQAAFYKCALLQEVCLPSTLKYIGPAAFKHCNNLKNINLNEGLKSLGKSAFSKCYSLQKIEIPSSTKTLQSYTFYNCSSLNEIIFHEGLTVIEENCMYGCDSLEKIEFPRGLTFLNNDAVNNCDFLNEVILPNSIENIYSQGQFSSLLNYISIVKSNDIINPDAIVISIKEPTRSNIKTTYKYNKEIAFFGYEETAIANMIEKGILIEEKEEKINEKLVKNKIKLPYKLIEFLSCYNKLDYFLENAYFKNFRRIYNIIPEKDKISFYGFAYNIGCFSKDKEFNHKANAWLESMITPNKKGIVKLSFTTIAYEMDGFDLDENKEFAEFLFGKDPTKKESTVDELINLDCEWNLLLEKIHHFYCNKEEYLNKGKCVIDEKGNTLIKVAIHSINANGNKTQKIKNLKPTIENFIKFFVQNEFEHDGSEELIKLSALLGNWDIFDQEDFDYAKKILKKNKSLKINKNILNEHLKEEIMQYDKLSNELLNEGLTLATDTVNKLTKIINDNFTYDWLEKDDQINLILGLLCDCCSYLTGQGQGIMASSFLDPNIQNLIIRDKDGRPISKATAYLNREEGYIVFNTIKVANHVKSDHEEIYAKYIKGIEDFVESYNKNNPEKPIKKVNVGMNFNDLEKIIKKENKPSKILPAIDFTIYGGTYGGDWQQLGQYTLWENKDIKDKRREKNEKRSI